MSSSLGFDHTGHCCSVFYLDFYNYQTSHLRITPSYSIFKSAAFTHISRNSTSFTVAFGLVHDVSPFGSSGHRCLS